MIIFSVPAAMAWRRRSASRPGPAVWCCLVWISLALLFGCGSRMGASAGGTVTVGGEPLRTGLVAFHPESGPIATAQIQSNGSYQVRTGSQTGLAPGEYVVTVTAVEGDTSLPTAENPNPKVTFLVPPRYGSPATSELRYTVKPEKNVFQISLEKEATRR